MNVKRRVSQFHGLTINGKKHPIYKLRERMMRYCYALKPNDKRYPYYKGKGIKVCNEWIENINAFYNWCINNNYAPGLVIDRVDSSKDYTPENCRFITKSENSKKARAENDQRGIKASSAKLCDDSVRAIRILLKLGFSMKKIGLFFGVGASAICAIKMKQTWTHVKD